MNSNSDNWAVVKAAITAGHYPNVLDKNKVFTGEESKCSYEIAYHPSSVFQILKSNSLPTKWLVYHQKLKFNDSAFLQYCTIVSPLTIVLFSSLSNASNQKLSAQLEEHVTNCESNDPVKFNIDKNIEFCMSKDQARTIIALRKQITNIFCAKMASPSKTPMIDEEGTINTIVNMLSVEEETFKAYFKKPEGVGQRPKQMNQVFSPVLLNSTNQESLNIDY